MASVIHGKTLGNKNSSLIQFSINGEPYMVGSDVPPSLKLVQFIREWAQLPGTKSLCHEGGCGICTVVATKYDLETDSLKTFSVQSCQTLVYACAGWQIVTIEHLGNRFTGYHRLQKALTGFYGTQCGFCSPGFVMTMYGQLQSSDNLTVEQVEKSLDGNLCRCTGYRPILDAFKSVAIDASPTLSKKLIDIEEIYASCPKTGKTCAGLCADAAKSGCSSIKTPEEDIVININEVQWYRPTSIQSLSKILTKFSSSDKVRLVVGNTGQGVYKDDGPYNIYVDTSGISTLYSVEKSSPLTIGANVSLARCIEVFHQVAKNLTGYGPLEQIAKHWEFVANVGVRNVGSWVGNLSMKHRHPEFPSDIFLTLSLLDTVLKIHPVQGNSPIYLSIEEFMKMDMSNSFIISMQIPPQGDVFVRTYKITQRAVNSHAYVNAAFKFKVDANDQFKLTAKPYLLFGGIRPDFVRATNTEEFLDGRRLALTETVKEAAKKLSDELNPDAKPQDASPAYRTSLSQTLLYKAILDLVGSAAEPKFQSGGPILVRPISSSEQKFDANQDSWPLGQAMPKLESNWQVAGEAEYINDVPCVLGELHGAFVQTTVANASIALIDPSEALKVPGVIAFICEKDIPGHNSFVSTDMFSIPDPIFVSSHSSYAGQAVGLITAKTRDIALEAAKLVRVDYTNKQKLTLTIKEALATGEPILKDKVILNNIEGKPAPNPKHTISGIFEQGSQFHFYTEPLSAIVVPKEEGFDVWASTQWPSEAQSAVADALGIQANRLNFTVRRIGGGFGGKLTRGNIVTCAAAVASNKLRKPVRIVLPLDVNMTLIGWREPYYSSYQVGFTEEGVLQTVDINFLCDVGLAANDESATAGVDWIPSVYYSDIWNFVPKYINTDTASNTWCRAPGTTEAIATMENIIEHVASYLNKEPSEIREINFSTDARRNIKSAAHHGENIAATTLFPMLKKQSMYDARKKEIESFNKENRWKKKGISIMPVLYFLAYGQEKFSVQVVIYAFDGTVVISHGGVEMGQGINTKVAQLAAKTLGIPVDFIKIKVTNLFVGANSASTGGSVGSDLCGFGTKVCCEALKKRIDVIAEEMKRKTHKKPDWIPLIKQCLEEDVDLAERYWTAVKEHPKGYDVFAAACIEVQIDVLTGQFLINRADVIEDCGRSMSPYIDIGQVEGALIMSFGYFTSEIVKYNPETGQKLTNGTWEYKVPTALDIPVDFRVSLLHSGDNPFGVARSKATGEPPFCLGYCLVTALRDAIKSARADTGDDSWFVMDTPLTVEKIQQLCKVDPSFFDIGTNKDHRYIKSNL